MFIKLKKAHQELNKRIFEHDQCMTEGKIDKKEITLQVRTSLFLFVCLFFQLRFFLVPVVCGGASAPNIPRFDISR